MVILTAMLSFSFGIVFQHLDGDVNCHASFIFRIVFSACVAAVKSRPVLHHCVVIFFWSSGIMECTCMLFTFENGVLLMR